MRISFSCIALLLTIVSLESILQKFSIGFSHKKIRTRTSVGIKQGSIFVLCSTDGDNDMMRERLMSIDELKAELELRGVDFKDCFSKSELVNRLIESRVAGKAIPDILDKFNSVKVLVITSIFE